MLDTLRRIVQKVNAAPDLAQALEIIVQRVREAVGVDVASVYLMDAEHGEYVLQATQGLRKNAIGKVRFNKGRGLVGMVGEREEPVNLDDAPSHPAINLSMIPARSHIMVFWVFPLFSMAMFWVCWLSDSARCASLMTRKKPSW